MLQLVADDTSDDDLSILSISHKSNNTIDITLNKGRRSTRLTKNSNKYSTVTMFESTQGRKSPRRMINVAYYFSDADSI